MHLVLLVPILFWTSGCSTAQDPITGPDTVSGQEQGSLTVQCHYDQSWKEYKKYWCQGAYWGYCKTLIKTDASEQLVKKNRLSIKDNQTDFKVTVTMEDLRISDAGIYWCAIEKTGSDLKFKVNVNIFPAPQATSPVLTTLPIISTTTMFTVTASVNETTSTFPGTSSHHNDDRPGGDDSGHDSDGSSRGLLDLSVLLPVISAVLLFLLLVASLLVWRMVRRQKKAAGSHSEQVSESLEGELGYANLALQQPRLYHDSSGKSMSSSGKAPQEEVEYVTMAPFPREEISYAALSLAALGQEPIYNNTGCFDSNIPSKSLEESTQYSSIKRS